MHHNRHATKARTRAISPKLTVRAFPLVLNAGAYLESGLVLVSVHVGIRHVNEGVVARATAHLAAITAHATRTCEGRVTWQEAAQVRMARTDGNKQQRTEHAWLLVKEQQWQLQLYEWQWCDLPEPEHEWHVEQHREQHS